MKATVTMALRVSTYLSRMKDRPVAILSAKDERCTRTAHCVLGQVERVGLIIRKIVQTNLLGDASESPLGDAGELRRLVGELAEHAFIVVVVCHSPLTEEFIDLCREELKIGRSGTVFLDLAQAGVISTTPPAFFRLTE
jgi:phosphohistidine phosphatase SixA